jgi:hypothetical protein
MKMKVVPLNNKRDFLLEDMDSDGAPMLLLGFRNEYATQLTQDQRLHIANGVLATAARLCDKCIGKKEDLNEGRKPDNP